MGRVQNIYERLTLMSAKLVTRYPAIIVIIFLGITAISAIPLAGIDTSTKMSDYTPHSEFLEADDVLRAEFNSTDIIICTFEAKDGNIMDREGLLMMQRVEQAIMDDDKVGDVLVTFEDPIITIADPVASTVSFLTGGAYDIGNCPDDVLENAIGYVLQDPNASSLVSVDETGEGAYAIMLIYFRYDLIEKDDESAELSLIRTINTEISDDYKMTTFAGLNKEMEDDAMNIVLTLVPIALVLVLVVLMVSLRNIVDMVISFFGIICAVIISFGLYTALGLQFSQMTYFAPLIMIVLSIDYSLHLLLRYKEYRKGAMGPKKAMGNAIRFMGISILLSTLTTSIAFASNGFSNIPAVSAFGIFLGFGIGISFLVMLFFVPAMKLLSLKLFRNVLPDFARKTPTPIEVAGAGFTKGVGNMGRFCFKFSIPVILVALLLFGGGMFLATQLTKDVSPKDTMSPESSVVQTIYIMDDEFPSFGAEQANIIVIGDVADPAFLEALNQSMYNMMDDNHVAKVFGSPKAISILPYVQTMTMYQNTIVDADNNGIPDSREDLLWVLDRLYNIGINGVVEPGKIRSLLSKGDGAHPYDMTLIQLETKDVGGDKGKFLHAELEEDMQPLYEIDGVDVQYAGFVFERFKMMTEMTDGMILSTAISIALCTLIVIILFRSIRFGVVTAVPVVLVTGWILGSMYILGFSLNVVTATITAMTIGIGIDYSIHLTERFRHERALGSGVEESMSKSIETTGLSLVAAGVTTFSGFFVMFFNDIGMFRTFGILASLMIVFATLSSLTVLPATLVLSENLVLKAVAARPEMPVALKWVLSCNGNGKRDESADEFYEEASTDEVVEPPGDSSKKNKKRKKSKSKKA